MTAATLDYGSKLSGVLPTVPDMLFEDIEHWLFDRGYVLRAHLAGPLGETDFVDRTVSLRIGLPPVTRDCTMVHESIHVERGPVVAGHYDREELRVQKETAERLLPKIKDIGDAYAWAQGDDHGAAAELGVDVDVLRTRMKYMKHPAEKAYLVKRFAEGEEQR